ncbi:MAG: Na/Pi cotransporter family protein [Oscillospiraceae bacterium]|nr:Na/Pi cotransporter family protein [Oscillospiraceae bacterium]
MTVSDYLLQIISLLGGLALFLFGMDVMGKSLERLAGGKLQTILAKMSSTVFRGFFLGIAVTAVIQSSSATTVMVVGFVNSGIMTLKQAIGVIMGSNVGTTVTSWLLSLTALEGDSLIVQIFKPSTLAPLLGIVGIVLFMFTKREKNKGIGTILLGFMALMTGMELMSESMAFLKEEAWFSNLMGSFSNPILGIIAGAALTALIQSSSASVGILQGLCSTGAITVGNALPIILGQNIGTCVTAMISTVGANRNARRTALVHLYFNIVGVAIIALIVYGCNLFYPLEILAKDAGPMDIAILHTGFNLTATAILLPMNKLLEKLAYLTIPRQEIHQTPVLLDSRLLATPAVAIQRSMDVAVQMADAAQVAMEKAISLTKQFNEDIFEQVRQLENQTDAYEDALGSYLVQLTGQKLTVEDNRILNTVLYTISDFERIADHAMDIAKAGREMHQKNIRFSPQAVEELAVLEQAVTDVIAHTFNAFRQQDLYQAMKVEPQEQVVDALVKEVKSRHVRRLRDGLCTVEYGFVLEDLLTNYERSADHCSNVAVEMLQVSEGKLEAHEYLNALKSGQLRESAQFSERFRKYRARYTFPEEKE